MMYGFNFERLTKVTEQQKPYRGSDNRFPMEHRSRNEKYFFVEEENGEKVYDIVYGSNWRHEDIDKETYDSLYAIKPSGVWAYEEYDHVNHKGTGNFSYYKVIRNPNFMARVRSDNTVEFTKDEYHQGERNFLSQNTSGGFINDSRRGGLIYKHYGYRDKRNTLLMHAIHKGMRIACDSDMAVVPYEVELKKVDRRLAKETLKPYEDFFKVSEVMCKAMPYEQLKDLAIEVCKERIPSKVLTHINSQELLHEARLCTQSAPLDALVLYALAYDVNRFAWSFRWGRTISDDNGERSHQLYIATKRRILKDLYTTHKEIFKPYRVQGGVYFPASEWGTEVIVNGKVIQQL